MAATSVGNSGLTPTALVVGAAATTFINTATPGSYTFESDVNALVDGDRLVFTVNLKVVPGGTFRLFQEYVLVGAQNAKVWALPGGAIWAPNGIQILGALPTAAGNRVILWEAGRVDS